MSGGAGIKVLLVDNTFTFGGAITSAAHLAGTKGVPRFTHESLERHRDGLVILTGCRHGELPRRLLAGDREGAARALARLERIAAIGGLYIELQHHLLPDDDWLTAELARLAHEAGLPTVVTNDAHYALRSDRELQDVLVSIRHGRDLEAAAHLRRPNGEYALKDGAALAALPPGHDSDPLVRHAWLDAYYWHRAHELVSESRPFFSDLATIARSLYAVGRRNQQDVLRAELELSRLDDRLIDIDRQYAGARAALSEWVGENAARPMATGLPNWSHVPELGEIHQGLLRHPALRAADDEIASREARVDLAEEGSKPGWALDLGYSYREGVLATGEPRSDFVSLVLTVDLPFFSKKSVDSNLSAALFDRRAAQETKAQLQRRLFSRLDAEYARWHDLSRRIDLYEQLILLQTEDQARASLVAYQSGNGDFADVMRGYIDNLNTRLEHIRLQVERAQSYALLANLGGISQ